MITRTRNLRTAIREAELEILEVEEPGDTAIEIGRYTFTGTEDSA